MSYRDIGAFMSLLTKKKQLVTVGLEVDPYLEVTEIADRVVKKRGPALLFEQVKGSPFPLLIGAMGTYQRMAWALGADSLREVQQDIGDLINFSRYTSIPTAAAAIPELTRLLSVFPQRVFRGPCQEVIEEPNLDLLPILHCWPQDGGRFITLPLVFTRDPETGAQNMGMYRMQVYDSKTTGMHWHFHKDGKEMYEKYHRLGKRMPVSVVIGCDPAVIYAATAPLPSMLDEILFAGYLRKRPVPMVKSIMSDIRVPAHSEFVLEGYIDTEEPLREEGPFGDHTGYYSEKGMYPVFHVTKMTRKKQPVFMATIVGQPPMEDCYMGKATERLFLPLMQIIAPEIVDFSFPLEGVFHGCVIVSIHKKYPAHAKKIMNTLWGMGQMMYTKMIVVVDADVNPHDSSKVAWKVFNNIDAKRDLVISEGPLDALDHASDTRLYGNRLGVDATRTWPSEGYTRDWPDDIVMSEDIKQRVSQRWREYGIR